MRISQILDGVFRAGYKAKMLGRAEHALAISDAEAKTKTLVDVNTLNRIIIDFINTGERSYGFRTGTASHEDDTMLLAKTLKQHIDSL